MTYFLKITCMCAIIACAEIILIVFPFYMYLMMTITDIIMIVFAFRIVFVFVFNYIDDIHDNHKNHYDCLAGSKTFPRTALAPASPDQQRWRARRWPLW